MRRETKERKERGRGREKEGARVAFRSLWVAVLMLRS